MHDASDDRLKRLFAQASPVQADPAFVSAVMAQVRVRRRRRQRLAAAAAAGAIAVAVTAATALAPFAPAPNMASAAGDALGWPDRLASAATGLLGGVDPLFFWIAAAALAPCLLTAWLVRRS